MCSPTQFTILNTCFFHYTTLGRADNSSLHAPLHRPIPKVHRGIVASVFTLILYTAQYVHATPLLCRPARRLTSQYCWLSGWNWSGLSCRSMSECGMPWKASTAPEGSNPLPVGQDMTLSLSLLGMISGSTNSYSPLGPHSATIVLMHTRHPHFLLRMRNALLIILIYIPQIQILMRMRKTRL